MMDRKNDFSTISGWTVPMIDAAIHDIENKLLNLEKEYQYEIIHLLVDLKILHDLREMKQGLKKIEKEESDDARP